MKVRKRWKQEFYDFLMLSSRNCGHSFSRNEITVVVIEYIDYFLVIIINEIVLFICILVVCTLPIFCIVCTVLGFKHVTVLVQYNRYQQIVDVLSLQCASESIKVRPPFFLASSTRHARSETLNKNSVHSGLFGMLLYFRVHWWKNSTKPSEINERRPNARVGRTRYQTVPRDQFLPLRHIHDAFVFH